MSLEPAIGIVTPAEAEALRIAVHFALREGLATDLDGWKASNMSLLSVARKLGIDTERYEP